MPSQCAQRSGLMQWRTCLLLLLLGCAAASGDSQRANFTELAPRLLASISSDLPNTGIALRLTVDSVVSETPVGQGLSAQTAAGKIIQALELRLTNGDTFSSSAAKLKLVEASVDVASAQGGACTNAATSLGLSKVNAPFSETTGAGTELQNLDSTLRSVLAGTGLTLKMGGTYKLCYSDTGTFAPSNVDLLDVTMAVSGADDSCTTADCLTNKRYNCYARKGEYSALGSCTLSIEGFQGSIGKASWSSAWEPSWDSSTGTLQSLTPKYCGISAPDSTVWCPQDTTDPVCEGSDRYIEPEAASAGKKFVLPQTKPLSTMTQAYTFAACYCPGLDGCDADSEYVQQIGVIYTFASKLCEPGQAATCASSNGFSGVAPQRRFNLMVHCPPEGCPASDTSRVKLVPAHADNNKPSWDSQHGCRTAIQTPFQTAPDNCLSRTNCLLSGGSREDWKFFGESAGILLAAPGDHDYERLGFHTAKSIDICFCAEQCTIATNWFKVGSLVMSPYRFTNLLANQVASVNVHGKLGFYRSSVDQDSIGLEASSVLKLLADPAKAVGDAECGASDAQPSPDGQPYAGDKSQLVYDGGTTAGAVRLTEPGIIAICYCPKASCQASEWSLAARYEIRGPKASQVWTVSTGIAVRLDYIGQNLDSSATLRIVRSDINCDSNSGNPDTESSLKWGCPYSCTSAGNMNLATHLLDHNSVRCDMTQSNCDSIYVRSLIVQSATTTNIEFTGEPGLQTGDRIAIGQGVQCGSTCTAEQLAVATGTYPYGDSGIYTMGIPVTATPDLNIFTLPIGWSSNVPKFEVPSGKAHWKRLSEATTAEELKSDENKEGLKVCWGYGGDGTYVAEAGLINFLAPKKMDSGVSLTTRAKGQAARIVISFSTTDSGDYSGVENEMQLKIIFLDVRLLEPHFTNQDAVAVVPGWDEHSIPQATQAACGKLFHELWSLNDHAGFPLPKGCYYKMIGNTRELCIVFEKKNGLQRGKAYQVVLTATAKSGLDGQSVVDVKSMGDVVTSPYHVVESGETGINRALQDGASGSSPQFAAVDGFEILGGTNSVLEFTGSEFDLRVQLTGHPSGRIVKESILRMFMWPLTQWYLTTPDGGTSCTASCEPHPGTQCGAPSSCKIEEVVSGPAGGQKNIIYLKLNSAMDEISDTIKHVLRIRSLVLPNGGFFPGRIAVQVSAQDDSQPHYVISSGDYIWKQPALQATVSELVIHEGDGNNQPFRGQIGNILHLHLALGATLHSVDTDRLATFSVTLPAGYVCSQISATPETLSIFSDTWGRGTLDSKRWFCTGNILKYTVALHEAVYAGSSLFVGLTVTNPPKALPRSDPRNRWYLSMRSAGTHTTVQTAGPLDFNAQNELNYAAYFSTNVAVLGQLADACLQPTDFRPTSDHQLYIFFKTEQSAGFLGYVVVDAPSGFDFGTVCNFGDLDAAYYSSTAGQQTFPLPEPAACGGFKLDKSSDANNRAIIQVRGHLRPGRIYGFQIAVTNPSTYEAGQQTSWRIWTRNQAQSYIDGTANSVSFVSPGSAGTIFAGEIEKRPSWGLSQSMIEVGFHVDPLLPWSMTVQEARIVVFPLRVASDVTTTLRVTAPYGYVWFFSDEDFVYTATPNAASLVVAGATADLPGGVPRRRGNIITWSKATYLAKHTYGFFTKIRVPNYTPTQASNTFFVEFGYDETDWSKRAAAARIAASPVRALVNAVVEYKTNLQTSVNRLRFTVMTATAILFQGGILIRGPRGFRFSETCYPDPAYGSASLPLPPDALCSFMIANSGEAQIRISAGETGIPVGYYGFELTGINPSTAVMNTEGDGGPCGWSLCWTFYTLSFVMGDLNSPELDSQISVPGFTIARPMVSAKLLPLHSAARAASGRDDRPLQPNWLTFSFELSQDVLESGTMTLSGPDGFIFAEDCLAGAMGGIRTVLTDIFGSEATSGVMQSHSEWEAGVDVTGCEGAGSRAHLLVGAGMKKSKSYVFSIHVASNPEFTAQYNKWTIEFAGESSVPFDGFTLWTFTGTDVKALTSSAGSQNLVNITFSPYNPIPGEYTGALLISPPVGYTFPTQCNIHLEEIDPLHMGALSPSVIPTADLLCAKLGGSLIIQLTTTRTMVAGRIYTLMMSVQNPPAVTPVDATPPSWDIRSFADANMQIALDTASVVGIAINKAMPVWARTGDVAPNGGVVINNLVLGMTFPDDLFQNDLVVIYAPSGYNLGVSGSQEGQEDCTSLQWGPGDPAPISMQSRASCKGNRLVVQLLEDRTIFNNTEIHLRIGTANPAAQPVVAANYWHAEHRSPVGAVKSSAVFQGWKIVPQLEEVKISLVGTNIAAGSESSIEVRFVAVSPASVLTIHAKQPEGFDFGQGTLPTTGQSKIDAVNGLIQISLTIVPGKMTTVLINKVKLAKVGGPTLFDITTLTSSQVTGVIADQKLGFAEGFRQPGSISTSDTALQSLYSASPAQYPVRGRWPAQLGSAIIVSFTLEFSNIAEIGQLLVFQGAGYVFQKQDFTIQNLELGGTMDAEVSSAAGGELRASLRSRLLPSIRYKVSLHAVAPKIQPSSDSWTIQTTDGGALPVMQSNAMPMDGTLVASFNLKVSAQRSPPGAEVEVSLSLFLGEYRPTLLKLIAPLGFGFPEDCLVDGGRAITQCRPGRAFAGQPTAVLRCSAANMQNVLQGLKVTVKMPSQTPAARSWFVEGSMFETGALVGWGEDGTGFQISPMRDVSVLYAGVPAIKTQVAVRFLTSETINRGGQVRVIAPSGFEASCAGHLLQVISLPGILECVIDESSVSLMLNDTLTAGEYGFGFSARTPSETPSPNVFSVLLIDERGKIQDSAMNLPGQTIQDQLSLLGTPLMWTSSEPGQASSITMGLRVTSVVPKGLLGTILITFPENFGHAIEKWTSVVSKQDTLPVQGGQTASSWLDYSMVDRIIIHLDPDKDLLVGEYQLEFPVTVPEQMPAFNVWLLTLCRYSTTGTCLQPQGSLSMVTFPFAGFNLHQGLPQGTNTGAAAQAARGAGSRLQLPGAGAVVMALLSLAFAA